MGSVEASGRENEWTCKVVAMLTVDGGVMSKLAFLADGTLARV